MRLDCIAGHHDVAAGEIRNQGFGFSHCRQCRRDMVRSNRDWRPVPRGFRVVWRCGKPRQTEINAAQLLLDMPSVGRSLIAPSRGRRSRIAELCGLLLIAAQFLTLAAAGAIRIWLKTASLPRAGRMRPMRLVSHVCPASAGPAL